MARLRNIKEKISSKVVQIKSALGTFYRWTTHRFSFLHGPLGVLLLVASVSLIYGLLVAPQGLVVSASIFVVILIGCIWPWIGIRSVSCQLKFATPRTEEGKAVEVELVITNRWPWPIWGLAIERGFSHSTELDVLPVTAISRIGGWSQSHFRWEFVPEIRGRYPVSRPQLVTEFPFGLWKAKRRINVESNLIVWPQRFSLPPVMLSCGEQSFSGQPSESSTGNIGHRTAVREYRRGDSVRQIHWTKTALYDKLVSFEREGFTLTEATIVLDTHPSLHRGTGSQSTFEQSIRIAASVSESLLHQGVKLTINTNTGKFESESRNSPALLDWLALFDNEVKPAQKLSERSPRTPWKRSLRVHITTDLSNSVESDSIVILTTPESSKEAISRVHSRCWMVVKRGVDLSSQIRNGWQSVPRSLQRAI